MSMRLEDIVPGLLVAFDDRIELVTSHPYVRDQTNEDINSDSIVVDFLIAWPGTDRALRICSYGVQSTVCAYNSNVPPTRLISRGVQR